jgi:DNA-binding response OmpR family regulator
MEALEPREFPQGAGKPTALRVLVVDDELLIRWSLAETLSDRGHLVVQTANGSGARSAVQEGEAFDVVLLDYCLPDSSDLSLLARFGARCRARVIMMTAFGHPEVVRAALDLGAYRVIGKPFEMQAVAELVAEAAASTRDMLTPCRHAPMGNFPSLRKKSLPPSPNPLRVAQTPTFLASHVWHRRCRLRQHDDQAS